MIAFSFLKPSHLARTLDALSPGLPCEGSSFPIYTNAIKFRAKYFLNVLRYCSCNIVIGNFSYIPFLMSFTYDLEQKQ